MIMHMKSLSKKPFYSSIPIIVSFPLGVFLINEILVFLFGIRSIHENRIDNIIHGLGGVSVCLSSGGVLWHLMSRGIVKLQDENVFRFLVFGFLCFVVICWEILEYILYHPSELFTYADTISDMVCGLIGGLFAMLVIRKIIPNEKFS